MDDLWHRMNLLEGRTVRTATGKPFAVLSVDGARNVVILAPLSTGTSRRVRRRQLDQAAQLGSISDLTPSQVQASGVTARNSAHIVGLLQAAYSINND